ncbi:hypothetical protein FQR65_LT07698 [Abscondita terminalis]|nr:hypothetical protein FQR65_LT07698 [Abscondita terminalis]
MDFKDKVALVTGGASGYGRAYCEELVRQGCKVAICDINNEAGEDLLRTLSKHGRERVIFCPCDVTDYPQFEEAFHTTISKLGGIDVVINNASVMNDRLWELEVDVNLIGTIRGTLLACQYVGKEGLGQGGVVVNVAGVGGIDPVPPAPTLSAAEHAIVGLSKSFGSNIHTSKSGIRVVCFCPGFTSTNFIKDLPRKGMTSYLGREFEILMNKSKRQGPDPCGHSVVHLIRHGDNGSVWVCEGAKLYCLNIPRRKAYSSLVAQYL